MESSILLSLSASCVLSVIDEKCVISLWVCFGKMADNE